MPLVHTSGRVLEFESLRDLLRGYGSSPLGGGRIEQAKTEPHLQPTVFIPGRRGEDVSWYDVVARKV